MSRPLLFGVLGIGFESDVFSLQPLSSAVTRTATLSHNGIPSAVRRPLARLVAQDEFRRVTGLARRQAHLLVDAVLPARNFAHGQLSLQHFSIGELAAAKMLGVRRAYRSARMP